MLLWQTFNQGHAQEGRTGKVEGFDGFGLYNGLMACGELALVDDDQIQFQAVVDVLTGFSILMVQTGAQHFMTTSNRI